MAEATTRKNSTNGATVVADHNPLAATSPAAASASFKSTDGRTTEGLRFNRVFSKAGVSPYDEVQWEHRDASITDFTGKPIFFQKDVEVPIDWSVTATNIVASKYLHGPMEAPQTSEKEGANMFARTVFASSSAVSPRRFATGASRTTTSPRPKTPRSSTMSLCICS